MMQQNDFMMCVSAMDYNSPMLNSTVPPITVERPFVNAVSSPLSELLAESDEDEDFFRLDTLKPRSYSFGAQPQRAFFNKTDTRRFLHNITKGQSKTPKPAKTTTVSRFSLMKQPPYVVNGATTTAASYNNNNDALMLRQQLQLRQQHQQASLGPSSSHSSATAASVTLANVHYMPSSQHHITAYPMGGQPGPVLPPTPSGELEELEPVRRDRCNTWPAVRANLDIKAQTSPLIHEEIPEEENVYDSSENINSGGSQLCCGLMGSPDPDRNDGFSPNGMCSPIPGSGNIGSGGSDTSETGQPNSANKKSSTRRNAWGNMSYADLITQAINSSPEKRLTLSQVYEWMVQNVPYFRDKGDSNSSAGWKNSIRHNLSLHSRFMRIQNEGAGKSSWWVINPDAKPGRNPRRQRSHTMETTTKTAIEKKRRGARKKVMELQQRAGGPLHSNGSSVVGSQISLASRDLYPNDEDVMNNYDAPFRNRADSNLSVPGTISRVSPTMNHFDDSLDFPAWVEAETTYNSANVSVPHDIVRDTSNIQLDPSSGGGRPMNNASTSPYRRHPTANSVMKGGTSPLQVKQEPLDVKDKDSYQPPPSYQELRTVPLNDHHQRANQLQQNPLLISQLPHLNNPKITGIGMGQQAVYYAPNGAYTLPPQPSQQTNSTSGGGATIQHWPMQHNSVGCGIPAQFGGGQSALPNDLAGLTFEQGPFESMDTESLLRQELAMNSTLSFDNI